MAKDEKGNIIVGLDIGTTKVCCIIAEAMAAGCMDVIGVGTSVSRGLKKGVVVDLESTIDSITKAIVEAERMSGRRVSSVHIGVTGENIKGNNSHGVIAVSRTAKEITAEDRQRVIEHSRTIQIPAEQEVIHVIPQEFILDGQGGIKDPVGLAGVRLEARVHIITALHSALQNITKSVNRSGFAVGGIVLQPLAAAEAVLTSDEKELGVVLADLGGGTTDLAMFAEGSLWHTSIIGIGGNQVTNDVAIGLRTSPQNAEEIKKSQGKAMAELAGESEEFTVEGSSGKPKTFNRRYLAEIIQPRLEEVFELIGKEIEKQGFEGRVGAGVVLTGGSSLFEGVTELAERVLNKPVRIGMPLNVGGLTDIVKTPLYATSVGLVVYGQKHQDQSFGGQTEQAPGGIAKKFMDWFSEYF